MRRKDTIISQEWYHVFNRGFNHQNIFVSDEDFERFLLTLIKYQQEFPSFKLYSYCLLPNHFHLLIKDERKTTKSCIPDFMRKLQNSYGKYFNMKYEKKGQVFEGRYQAKWIDDEQYFLQTLVYINQNAVKHSIVKDIRDWKYTSNNFFKFGLSTKSTPVLIDIVELGFIYGDIYNKFEDTKLTPVLEY